jgi:hypothetical protein
LGLIGLSFLSPRAGFADDGSVGGADQAAIRQVIQNQIAAFRRDDGAAAFSYASPSIRAQFGSPENFMHIVRNAYQPVYRPSSVEFGATEEVDGAPVQHVLVVAPDGGVVDALYFMVQQPDGSWLINGCVLTKSDQKTT